MICCADIVFLFKQKTAYEVRISDWSSDVGASDLVWVVDTGMPKWAVSVSMVAERVSAAKPWIGCSLTILWPIVLMIFQPPEAVPSAITTAQVTTIQTAISCSLLAGCRKAAQPGRSSSAPEASAPNRSEEHTSELQSLMRISYAVFCLKKKQTDTKPTTQLIT